MKGWLSLVILLIISLSISSKAFGFTLNNSAKLVFPSDEVSVHVAADFCGNLGISDSELLSIVGSAVDQFWNKSPTSRLKLRAGSLQNVSSDFQTETICLPATNCTPNPDLSVSSDILISCNNNVSNFPSSSILAVTVPTNISGANIIGSLILINDLASTQFDSKNRDEKTAIIAHEIGHAIGLGHSPVKDSLMYYATVASRRSLGRDDIDGITYLYPKQQPVSCGSIDLNQTNKTDSANWWASLLIGFILISLIRSKTSSPL